MKDILLGKTLDELIAIVVDLGLPKFTAKQIVNWLYQKNISSIDEMSNLSKQARTLLNDKFEFGREAYTDVQISKDGTKKYLFQVGDGKFVESAYIPDKERHTLCVSSQVGCKMGCLFCMTAKQGFQQHLSAGQIINQIQGIDEREQLTNIVYMGMGEPFDNMDEVMKSLEILTAEYGFAMSPKRITVSTIGIMPGVKRFLEESKCHLAISLHTPFDDERRSLMPIENVYAIDEVVRLLSQYDLGGQRRISFEYILFKGVNDTPKHVKELSRLLSKIKCRINLIRFHPIPGTPLLGSDEHTIQQFKDGLNRKDIVTTVRASRGQDIFAACGLLSTLKKG